MIQTKHLALKHFFDRSNFESDSLRPQDLDLLLQLAPKKVDGHFVVSNNSFEILCLLINIDTKSKCAFSKVTTYLLDFAKGIFSLKTASQYYHSKVTPRLELLEFDIINKMNLYLLDLLSVVRHKGVIVTAVRDIVTEVFVPKFKKLVLTMSDYVNPLEQNFDKNEILWLRSLLKLPPHNPFISALATKEVNNLMKDELNKMMKIPVVQQTHDGFYKTGVLLHMFRSLDIDMSKLQFISNYTSMLIKRYLKFEEVNHKLLNPFRLALEVCVSIQERSDSYMSESSKSFLSLQRLLGSFLKDLNGAEDSSYVKFISEIFKSVEIVFWRIPSIQEKVRVIETLVNYYMRCKDMKSKPFFENNPAERNGTSHNKISVDGAGAKFQSPDRKKEELLQRISLISKMVLGYVFRILEKEDFDTALVDYNNSVVYNFIVHIFNEISTTGSRNTIVKPNEEETNSIKDPRKLKIFSLKFLYSLVKKFQATRINELIYNLISSRYSLKISLNDLKHYYNTLDEKKAQQILVKMKLQMSLNISDNKLFQKSMTELIGYYSETIEDPKLQALEELTYNLFRKVIQKAQTEDKLIIIWNQLTDFVTRLSKEIIFQAKPETYLHYFAKNLMCLKDTLEKTVKNKNTTLPRDSKFIERLIDVWIHIILNKQALLQTSEALIEEFALLTPRLIQASATSYANTFLINPFLNSQKIIDKYRRNMKHVLREKMIELRPKIRNLTLGEMIFLLSIDYILDVKIKEVSRNYGRIVESQKDIPFIEIIFCYVRDIYITEKENLREVIEELLTRKARLYLMQLLLLNNEKLQMKLVERDFVTMLQSSCSINRIYMKVSQIFLKDYIREFPKLIFKDVVISSLCEIVEFLYRKVGFQYDSVSSRVKPSHYNLKIQIPNNLKDINDVLVFLLSCLHSMCLRGYIIEGATLLKKVNDMLSLPEYKDLKHGTKIFKYFLWTLNNHITLTGDVATKGPAYWLYDKGYFLNKVDKFENKHLEETLKVISTIPPFSFEIHFDSKAVVTALHNTLKEFKISEESIAQLNALKEKNPTFHKIFNTLKDLLIHYYVYYLALREKKNKQHLLELFKDPIIGNTFDQESKEMMFAAASNTINISERIKAKMDQAFTSILSTLQLALCYMKIYPDQASQVLQKIYTLVLCLPVRKLTKYVVKTLTKNVLLSLPSQYSLSVLRALFFLFQESIFKFNAYTNITGVTKIKQSHFDLLEVNSELFNPITYKDLFRATNAHPELKENINKSFVSCKDRDDMKISEMRSIYSIRHFLLSFSHIHKDIMVFVHNHVSVLLANQISPLELLSFLQENFEIRANAEYLKSANIFSLVSAHLAVLDVLKNYPLTAIQKRFVQKFYYNTLKLGLNYFSKNSKFYVDDTYESELSVHKIEKKMELGIKACRYLKGETFMENMLGVDKVEGPLKFPPVFLDLNLVNPASRTKLLFKFQDNRSRWFYTSLSSKFVGTLGLGRVKRNIAVIYDPSNEKKTILQNAGALSKFQNLKKLLLTLIGYELDNIKAFNKTELGLMKYEYTLEDKIFPENEARTLLCFALDLNPTLAIYLTKRLSFAMPVVLTTSPAFIRDLVTKYYIFNLQQQITLEYFIEKNLQNIFTLRNLFYWDTPQIPILMKYMTLEYEDNKTLQIFFAKTMKRLESTQLLFYLPQIYQTLNTRSSYLVAQMLQEYSRKSYLFSHQLIWKAKVESKREKHEISNNKLAYISCRILYQLFKGFNSTEKFLFKQVDGFFEDITGISGVLKPAWPKKKKEETIKQMLHKITVSEFLYVPCNPQYMISKIKLDSGRAMQSAAKCPILVSFYCKKFEGPDKYYEKLLSADKNNNEKQEVEVPDSEEDPVAEHDDHPSINDLKISSEVKLFPKETLNVSEQHFARASSSPLEKIPEKDEEVSPTDIRDKLMKQIDEENKLNLSETKIIEKNMLNNRSSVNKETNHFDFEKEPRTGSDGEEFKDPLTIREEQEMFRNGMRLEISYGAGLHQLPTNDIKERDDEMGYLKSRKFSRTRVTMEPTQKSEMSPVQPGKSKESNKEEKEKYEVISCIFKVFDDIRQDDLALQVINLFKYIFQSVGLDLFLFPYRTISNRTGEDLDIGGIIEVVPNTISRDQMGKMMDCNLYEYFKSRFGNELSQEFQLARENFIKSMAAYSIVSYILQIKDRHNGNILIDSYGHIVHIDFGFIFDISPAHNMKFESANFKLTKEMIQIMGGSQITEPFNYYVDQTIKAFLAVKRFDEHIFNMIKLMTYSGMKCFRVNSLQNLKERFMPKLNELQAAVMMKKIILDAYDKLTTNLYDDIQHFQNKIHR